MWQDRNLPLSKTALSVLAKPPQLLYWLHEIHHQGWSFQPHETARAESLAGAPLATFGERFSAIANIPYASICGNSCD
jgi:hypothetical protein